MTALNYRNFLKLHRSPDYALDQTTDFIKELNNCLGEIEKTHQFSDTYNLLQNMLRQ